MNWCRPCLYALALVSLSAEAVEVMPWKRLPLNVALNVGEERVLFVDEAVRVGVPASLAGALRVQSANGAVYLKATEPFDSARLQLELIGTGEYLLIDLKAQPGEAELEPVQIVLEQDLAEPEASKPSSGTPIPVTLVRYAAQSLYAPQRTIEPLPGVSLISTRLKGDVPLLTLHQVVATPLAAWRLGDCTVTAVKLRHQGEGWVELDPRELQASLFAATFQHQTLGPRGTPEDTTVAYLVTQHSNLADALWLPVGGEHAR